MHLGIKKMMIGNTTGVLNAEREILFGQEKIRNGFVGIVGINGMNKMLCEVIQMANQAFSFKS
jgi:hypothetical protein